MVARECSIISGSATIQRQTAVRIRAAAAVFVLPATNSITRRT